MSLQPTTNEGQVGSDLGLPMVDGLRSVGLNHRSAAVELRERLAIAKSEAPAVLRELRGCADEVLILSTCNRTEFFWIANDQPVSREQLLTALPHVNAAVLAAAASALYEFGGLDVARHLFRVVAGLESLVVGETQILHQVKESYELARAHGACSGSFNFLFQKAFEVAKAVRTETRLASRQASVPAVAIGLASAIFDDFSAVRVLLVGTGEIAQVSLDEMRRRGAKQVTAISRNPDQRQAWAAAEKVRLLGMDALAATVKESDVVIACTIADEVVLRPQDITDARGRVRRARPLMVLDLGVPRNVDNAVRQLENVFLRNVDDLQATVDRNRAALEEDIQHAEAVIETGLNDYLRECRAANAGSTIREFRSHAQDIAATELESALKRLSHLPADDQEQVRRLVHRVVGKIMHEPTLALRQASENGETSDAVFWVRRIFGLGSRKDDR